MSDEHEVPRGSVDGVWGETPERDLDPSRRLELSEEERYEAGQLLGVGGMGRVVATHDGRLGRDVARKSAHNGPSGAKLAREAFITAQLDHPGIVPIYDAGTDEDGAPWYTMRLVRGRTLSEAITQTEGDRSALLRHLLAATQAVAYAHSRGYVHRDLKPDNILVGPFGETQVADWGLAAAVGESLDGAAPSTVGTPAYMSPEQVRGASATPRSDVWALGAALRQIVTGVTPFEGSDPQATLALRRAEAELPVPSDAPPELCAIITRAQASDPLERYLDAGALADDLARYLDGRRVRAHTYTASELLGRLVRLWKAPLAVAAIALAALTLIIAVAAVRQDQAKRRAQAAEMDAVAARARSEANLANAWVAQARTAERRQDRTRAERYALAALSSVELPSARGVLVAVDDGPRPERIEARPPVACDGGAVLPRGRWICRRGDELLGFDARNEQLWTHRFASAPSAAALPGGDALVWDGAGVLRHLEGASGMLGEQLPLSSDSFLPQWTASASPDGPVLVGRTWMWNLVNLRGGAPIPVVPCAEGAVGYSPIWTEEIALLCSDNTIAIAPSPKPGAPPHFAARPLALEAGASPARLAAWGPDGYVITTDFGAAALLDRATLEVRQTVMLSDHPLVEIAVRPQGDLVAVRGDRGDVLVWRPEGGLKTALPGLAHAIEFDPAGDLIVLGERWQRWRFPPPEPARVAQTRAGVSALTLRSDGEEAAACLGDGRLVRWSLAEGTTQEHSVAPGIVLKDGTYTSDGRFAVSIASHGPEPKTLVRFDSLWKVASREAVGAARRVEALGDGRLVVLDWSQSSPLLVSEGGGIEQLGWANLHDLAAAPSRRRVGFAGEDLLFAAELREDGTLLRGPSRVAPAVRNVAVDERGALFGTVPGGVVVFEADGREVWLRAPSEVGTAIAVSPGGGLVAAGDLEGTIWIWDRGGELLAEVRGHSARVSGLVFRSDDELVSGSWDATLRRWSLSSLRRSVEALRDELGPWGELRQEDLAGVP